MNTQSASRRGTQYNNHMWAHAKRSRRSLLVLLSFLFYFFLFSVFFLRQQFPSRHKCVCVKCVIHTANKMYKMNTMTPTSNNNACIVTAFLAFLFSHIQLAAFFLVIYLFNLCVHFLHIHTAHCILDAVKFYFYAISLSLGGYDSKKNTRRHAYARIHAHNGAKCG